jgi:SAM-dependent MidA family methyltransferase
VADDPRWAGSEPSLVEAIRDEILAAPDARITFARFMQRALTEPGRGYYASSELRPTRAGDFLSAPELHPLFGGCIARYVAGARQSRGTPGVFRVSEAGGGRGALRDSATEALDGEVEWTRADLPDRSDAATGPADLIIANEYLDALPVHRVVWDGRLHEAWVGWRDGWFTEVIGAPSTPQLAAHLEADGVALVDGQRAEIGLAASRWISHAPSQMAHSGSLLVIDYGHDAAELYGARRMAGSLLTYRDHKVADDPFSAVGHNDITTHVDITALERAALGAGLDLVGSTTQGQFLANLGLGEALAQLGREPEADAQAYLEARSAVARMLDPRHLGGFRVMAWSRPGPNGDLPTLPGFADLT